VLWNLYAACFDFVAELAPYQDMLDEVVAELDLRPACACWTQAAAQAPLSAAGRASSRRRGGAVDASPVMLARARRRSWPTARASWPRTSMISWRMKRAVRPRGERERDLGVGQSAPNHRTHGGLPGASGRMVHTTPRWRFRFDVIVAVTATGARRRGLVRALGLLLRWPWPPAQPRARPAGCGRNHAWRDRSRWQADGWRACSHIRPRPATIRPTYAGQGFLVTCDKTPASLI